jgi:putative ABC transport system ATP-binding protein
MPIVLNRITKNYGKGTSEFSALDNVSLKIDDGEMVAVMGPSGSGKSTLLNILGCIDTPTKGEYYLDEYNVEKLSPGELAFLRNEKVGFIFQYFALLNDYTVYENIELPLLKKGLRKKDRQDMINRYMGRFGILEQGKKRPQELSGGQQQRAAIIRALVTNPSYILADEPTGALDTKTSSNILEILKEINREGKTLVIITHDPKVAEQCKRVIRIQDGEIIDDINII